MTSVRLSLRSHAGFPLPVAFAALMLLSALARLPGTDLLVKPYVQPGPGSALEGADAAFLVWLASADDASFSAEYGIDGVEALRPATLERVIWDFPAEPAKANEPGTTALHAVKYTARLDDLPFDQRIHYRVRRGDAIIREDWFLTRASAGKPFRFAAMGDMAQGKPEQNAIAYRISLLKPRALIALGDIVYPSGRIGQYLDHFWSTYNQPATVGPDTGAPLMASIPVFAVNGNHDVSAKPPATADALGIYHFFRVPHDGPAPGPWDQALGRGPEADRFKAQVGPTYPDLGHYSFDDGPAHFLVLDNCGTDLGAPPLVAWIEADLRTSKAPWKFVCLHCPPFHSSREHYDDQRVRRLAPVFERGGVDLVLAGHVHNYQRTCPLRFAPVDGPTKLVDGSFTLDHDYNGDSVTTANGIIYLTAGGGGAGLYRGDLENNRVFFQTRFPKNWVPYTVKFASDQHSFVVIDLTTNRLEAQVFNELGGEIDHFTVSKP